VGREVAQPSRYVVAALGEALMSVTMARIFVKALHYKSKE
jgi:hypothetical protein